MNALTSFLQYRTTKHWARYAWLEKWKTQNLKLGKDSKIADVGAGHDPFLDATHIIDLYPDDNTQRGHDLRAGKRTLLPHSIEEVPVEDGYFDFSYARQILEHVDDPEKACKELMRISKSGFIETPNSFIELGYGYPGDERGWPYHKWYNWITPDNTIVFRRKTKENVHDYCHCMFGNFSEKIYKEYQGKFHKFLKKLPYPLRAYSLVWEGKFKYKIIDR